MEIWEQYNWQFWNPKTEPLLEEVNSYNSISLCTTCMGRTYDLKQLYKNNLLECSNYPNIEFVLLNYNSPDDMDEYVKNELMSFIDSGVLNYYKTTEPQFFEMGHSRNVAFKLAKGRIVNNVDADNSIRSNFPYIINELAEIQPEKAVFCKGKRLMRGNVGMYKDEFMKIGGYDEDLKGYGMDDHSLVQRALCSGHKMMWWGDLYHLERNNTPKSEKTKFMRNKSIRETEKINKKILEEKLARKEFVSNDNREWGKATVIKNFNEEIVI